MIPKIIHYCWFGGKEKPESVKKCIESWKKYCPDYQIIEWNESNYDVSKNKYMFEAYKAKKWGFVSDYARLDIIYENGGIYFDTDVEVIKSLDSLLDNNCFMGFEDGKHVSSGLGFGSEKHNESIKKIMEEIYGNLSFSVTDNTREPISCPILTTNLLLKYGLIQNDKLQNVLGITIYPTVYFCPKSYDTFKTKITSNTYSIHHFDMSWVGEFGLYRHNLQLKLNKFLPITLSKYIAKSIAIIKYRGLKDFFKTVKRKLTKNEKII